MKLKRIAPLGVLALLLTALLLVACAPVAEPPAIEQPVTEGPAVAETAVSEPLPRGCFITPGESIAHWRLGMSLQELSTELGAGEKFRRTEQQYGVFYREHGLLFLFSAGDQVVAITLFAALEDHDCTTVHDIRLYDKEQVLDVLGEPGRSYLHPDGRKSRYYNIGLLVDTMQMRPSQDRIVIAIGVFPSEE